MRSLSLPFILPSLNFSTTSLASDSPIQLDSFRVLLGDIMMAPDSQPDPDEQTVNEPEEIEPIPALNIIEPGGFSSLISASPSASPCQIGQR